MSMAIILYKTFELVICIFLFGLSESSKKTLFKGLIRKIIKAKVAEKCNFFALFRGFELDYLWDNFFNLAFLVDSVRENWIVQMNGSYALYSVIVLNHECDEFIYITPGII